MSKKIALSITLFLLRFQVTVAAEMQQKLTDQPITASIVNDDALALKKQIIDHKAADPWRFRYLIEAEDLKKLDLVRLRCDTLHILFHIAVKYHAHHAIRMLACLGVSKFEKDQAIKCADWDTSAVLLEIGAELPHHYTGPYAIAAKHRAQKKKNLLATKIKNALRCDNIDMLKKILKSNPEQANLQHGTEHPLLYKAIDAKAVNVVKFLISLDEETKPYQAPKYSQTQFLVNNADNALAFVFSKPEAIITLLEIGIDPYNKKFLKKLRQQGPHVVQEAEKAVEAYNNQERANLVTEIIPSLQIKDLACIVASYVFIPKFKSLLEQTW
jgi:hypothetical protein